MNWRILLPLIGSVFIGLSIVSHAWLLVLLGFIPLIYACDSRRNTRTYTIRVSLLYGLVLYGSACFSIFFSVPFDWLGVTLSVPLQYLVVGSVWAVCTFTLAVPLVLWALWVRLVHRGHWTDSLLLPIGWIVSEYVGAFVFSLITFGEGGLLGAHFTAGAIGYVLADDVVLRQLAGVGGIYALSAFVIGFNVLVTHCLSLPKSTIPHCAVGALCLLGAWGAFTMYKFPEDMKQNTITVSALASHIITYPAISRGMIDEYHSVLQTLVTTHASSQLIVLPENASFFMNLGENRDTVLSTLRLYAPIVIDSTKIPVEGGFSSRAEYVDAGTGVRAYSYKRFLAPFGEQISYAIRLLEVLSPEESSLRHVISEHTYVSGALPRALSVQNISMIALFCNEVLSPTLYSRAAREGAQLLVSLAAHDWFHGSRLVYMQLFRVAQVRAVESNRYFVQASNVSPAFILDDRGELHAETSWGEWGVANHSVVLRDTLTPYARFGSWIIPLCALLTLFTGLYGVFNARLRARTAQS